MRNLIKKAISLAVSCLMMAEAFLVAMPIKASAEDDVSSIMTDYLPTINEVIDENGFRHPGVGLTKQLLENVRDKVRAQKEPWITYFKDMLESGAASKTVTSSNESSTEPGKPATDAFNSQSVQSRFISDALKAYTQALLYFITGDEVYRTNAMHIIRIWSQMDPNKYAYYKDAHIHSGIPLNRMVTAAEILRYSSCQTPELEWTNEDTQNFSNNLINPVIDTLQYNQNRFMNQHLYSVLGSMAGHIFTGNKERYEEIVEWFTVNKTAVDQGFNGAVKQLFRWVDRKNEVGKHVTEGEPVEGHVQHIEMGRDQAHGGGDLTNSAIIIRMLLAQGTKVDPVEGTVSTEENAVGPYEFLNDRIMAAADYFWRFMLGYDTPWTPVAYSIAPDGTVKDTYNRISGGYRGRYNTANFWDFYSYYTYVRGIDVSEAYPYYYEAFTKKVPSNYYYGENLNINWDNVDGGGDFWLYIPPEAEEDAEIFLGKNHPSPNIKDIEIRYTAFDGNTQTVTEGDVSFTRFNATEEGARIAILTASTGSKHIGFKIRTNGAAQLEMYPGINDTLLLPDTKGEWRYVTYKLGTSQNVGDILYMTVKGPTGITVDIDHMNTLAGSQLSPPEFQSGASDLNLIVYVGTSVNLNLSAADPNSADTIAYDTTNLPPGAVLDSNGLFTWNPVEAGNYSFIISASDGTTVTAKRANITVAADRASAVESAVEPYDPGTDYMSASLQNFQDVWDDTVSQIDTASDEDFINQLQILRREAENLLPVTPLSALDNSIDYPKFVTSTFGSSIHLLLDNDNDTFTGFISGSDLYHIIDFGADRKVSPIAVGIQSRMNFTDRGAGCTVFASNDQVNWIRITPDETPFCSDMNILEVADEYKNQQFRFLKVEMITRYPDIIHNSVQNMIELGELRIFGKCHETDNKLESVTISSDQSLSGRIVLGSAVRLSIQAREPISDVRVQIQGLDATVTTYDNINWTAVAILSQGAATGKVQFSIDYKTSEGKDGDTCYFTTDGSTLFVVDESDLIQNVLEITKLIDSSGRTGTDAINHAKNLFDGNINSITDYRYSGSGNGGFIAFDFKTGNFALLNSVEIMARQDGYYTRIGGTVVQGSNDGQTWNTISNAAVATRDWQMLMINDDTPYRFIRIYNPNAWFGNMAELRLHGEVVSPIRDALALAASIDRTLYTAQSLENLDNAVAYAQQLLEDENAAITDIEDALNALNESLNALEYIPGMPVFESLFDQTIKTGDTLDFTVVATNVAGSVVYGVENLPSGASFDELTGRFQWTPGEEHAGRYTVTFTATAGELSSSKSIIIKVIGKPVVDPVDSVDLTASQTLNFRVPASDPAGEPLVFTAQNLPPGAVFDPSTGVLSWSPMQMDYGTYPVTFTVSNGSYTVTLSVTFNVDIYIQPSLDYTKHSYYEYMKQIVLIREEMANPQADKAVIAAKIDQAEELLVPLIELISEADRIEITSNMVVASDPSWDGKYNPAQNGWRAFDGDINTFTDNKNSEGWILVDLGEGNTQAIVSIEFTPRSGYVSRMANAVFQGSNDGVNFTNLYTVSSNISEMKTYTAAVSDPTPYRYLRYYASSGNANVSEIKYYSRPKDRTLLQYFINELSALDTSIYKENNEEDILGALQTAQNLSAASNQGEIDAAAALLQAIYEQSPAYLTVESKILQDSGTEQTVPVDIYLDVGNTAVTDYKVTLYYDNALTYEYLVFNPALSSGTTNYSVTQSVYSQDQFTVSQSVYSQDQLTVSEHVYIAFSYSDATGFTGNQRLATVIFSVPAGAGGYDLSISRKPEDTVVNTIDNFVIIQNGSIVILEKGLDTITLEPVPNVTAGNNVIIRGTTTFNEITVELKQPDGTILYSAVLTKSEFESGITVTIPLHAPGGTYTVGAGSSNMFVTREFTVTACSSDATLKLITIDGKPIKGFSAGKTSYTVTLPYGTNKPPVVGAEKTSENSTIVITQATEVAPYGTAPSGNSVSKITVTAQDGITTKTYLVGFVQDKKSSGGGSSGSGSTATPTPAPTPAPSPSPTPTPAPSLSLADIVRNVNSAIGNLIGDNDDNTLNNITGIQPDLNNIIKSLVNSDPKTAAELKHLVNAALDKIRDAAAALETDESKKTVNKVLAEILTESAAAINARSNAQSAETMMDLMKDILKASSNLIDIVESPETAQEMAILIIDSVKPLLAYESIAGTAAKEVVDELLGIINKVLKKSASTEAIMEFSGAAAKAALDETRIQSIIDNIDNMRRTAALLGEKLSGAGIVKPVQTQISINIPLMHGISEIKTEIPKQLLSAVIEKGVENIEISSEIATISIPCDFAPELKTAHSFSLETRKITLSEEQIKALTEEQRKLIEQGTAVYDFNAAVTDSSGETKKISQFDKHLNIRIPYTLKDGEDPDNITVLYLADDGTIQNMAARYDPDTRTVQFKTRHFSIFLIKNNIIRFSDVDESFWGKAYIEAMAAKGIISGLPNGTFNPGGWITRAEFAKLITAAKGIVKSNTTASFSDVTPDEWYAAYVKSASDAGIIYGYPDGTFRPNEKITREQMAVMTARALGEYMPDNIGNYIDFVDKDEISDFALDSVALLVKLEIMRGKNGKVMDPKGYVTRAEAAAVIYRLFSY